MDALRLYLNSIPVADQLKFAERCGTTLGYLRKAISAGQLLREKVVIAIERESGGAVTCELLRPDVDWGYLRGTTPAADGEAAHA